MKKNFEKAYVQAKSKLKGMELPFYETIKEIFKDEHPYFLDYLKANGFLATDGRPGERAVDLGYFVHEASDKQNRNLGHNEFIATGFGLFVLIENFQMDLAY